MREPAFETNRLALAHDTLELGKRLPNTEASINDRIGERDRLVLALVGTENTP